MKVKDIIVIPLAGCLLATVPSVAVQESADAAFGTSGPFFMFSRGAATETFGVINRYFQPRDFISKSVSTANSTVSARIDQDHTYTLPASLSGVQSSANVGCDSGGDPGLIMYNPEHWGATPPGEQADVPASIAQGAQIAHGAGCDYGVAPDGQFIFGEQPGSCSYDLNDGIYTQVDWTDVDYLDIQAQILLSDTCWPTQGVSAYSDVISTIADYARGQNPDITVMAQVSLRYTPPARIVSAVDAVAGDADGVYVAYPSTCSYCTPGNVRAIFQAYRGAPFFLHSALDPFGVRDIDGYPPTASSPATLSLNNAGGPMHRWTTNLTFSSGTVIPAGTYAWSYHTDGGSGTTATLDLEFGYCLESDYCSKNNRVAIVGQGDWTVTAHGGADGVMTSRQTAQPTTLPPGGPYKLYFVVDVTTAGNINLLYDSMEAPTVFTNTLQP